MDSISPLLTIIKDYLADPLTRHASYALKVKTKIETLEKEMSSLSVIERDVARKVDAARARLLNPFDRVIVWQEKVKKLKQEADEITNVIINGCSPNFVSRYKLGKRATQLLLEVKDFKEEGIRFSEGAVVDPPLPSDAEVNFKALREKVNTLTSIEADVVSLVNNAKWFRGLQPKHQVEDWLLAVDNHKLTANSICDEFEQMKEHCDLDTNNWVTISVNLENTLEKTKALISEGRCFTDEKNVIDPSRPLVVIQQSMIPSIGQDKAFHDTLNLIKDDGVRFIGIYGMGGVGKTTLLRRINNSLDGMGYEIVILVVVSGNVNIEAIQRDILKRLGKSLEGSPSTFEMGNMIRNCLDGKKFVLLLDDIWKKLDLNEVGLPIYAKEKNYKILFTTRFENVCKEMQATNVKNECLGDEESWKLFETTVGDGILNLDPGIMKIAELVAKDCGGLPLALILIGGSMRSKTTIYEWRIALSTLGKFEPELKDTMDELYMRLKFSYDSLPNSTVHECFCYCALFPEDYVISSSSLVDCWIGEGFFAECESSEMARSKGYAIIANLVRACLLEDIGKDSSDYQLIPNSDINNVVREYRSVKMHDVVRDMAHWIKKDKFVVFATETKALEIDKRDKVERLSLTTKEGLAIFVEHGVKFPHMSTLVMTYECLETLRDDFFLSMLGLKVLHIYDAHPAMITRLYSWPSSTWLLTQLRYLYFGIKYNSSDSKLEALANLQILKVGICHQSEVADSLDSLEGLVPKLAHLRVLHIWSNFPCGLEDIRVKIEDLKSLAQLEDLKLFIRTDTYFRELAACPKLAHCVSTLWLTSMDIDLCPQSIAIGSMDRLEQIAFLDCWCLEEIMIEKDDVLSSQNFLENLKSLEIVECPKLRTLYLGRTLPQLERITMIGCCHQPIEVLLSSRDGTTPYVFPELQVIRLNYVQLEYICSDTFSFPRLRILHVSGCKKLRRLPKCIIQASKQQLEKIEGEQGWWDKLEWDSAVDKLSLLPFFESA